MKRREKIMLVGLVAAFTLLAQVASPVQASTIVVPGAANPWLAGMPNGTNTGYGDVAPDQSPVLVQGIDLTPGDWVAVSNVTGSVNVGGDWPLYGGDGSTQQRYGWGPVIDHTPGAQFSKSNIWVPYSSLLGVFLNDDVPSGAAPSTLYFDTIAARDYLTLSPELNQVFFIGDGLTSIGIQQNIFVPFGATRLFLGTMDGWGWYDNMGAFNVTVVPEPATLLLFSLGGLMLRRKS